MLADSRRGGYQEAWLQSYFIQRYSAGAAAVGTATKTIHFRHSMHANTAMTDGSVQFLPYGKAVDYGYSYIIDSK